jgi:hypothetical protein
MNFILLKYMKQDSFFSYVNKYSMVNVSCFCFSLKKLSTLPSLFGLRRIAKCFLVFTLMSISLVMNTTITRVLNMSSLDWITAGGSSVGTIYQTKQKNKISYIKSSKKIKKILLHQWQPFALHNKTRYTIYKLHSLIFLQYWAEKRTQLWMKKYPICLASYKFTTQTSSIGDINMSVILQSDVKQNKL